MTPPITESIRQLRPGAWIIGSILCENITTVLPDGILASWKDDEGNKYCLRPSDQIPSETTGSLCDPIHSSGTSGAVWALGGAVVCKAKAWVEGMETEAETLRYVRGEFDIPVPEILHSWIDRVSSRSFLVLKRVDGETLQQAWPSLSHHQRHHIADQVAQCCEALAKETSDKLESVSGYGITDRYLLPDRTESAPSWRPVPFPRLSKSEAEAYLHPMDAGKKFYFAHLDLSPTNIMVSKDGTVTGILDWESAAFYPRVWIGTKPKVSYGFILEGVDKDVWAWRELLSEALQERRFVPDVEGFQVFRKRKAELGI